jgi:hypothetical protein
MQGLGWVLRWALGWVLAGGLALTHVPAQAQSVELTQLQASRGDGALNLEYAVRVSLPKSVEEALHRGVPVYFVAQAELKRSRWYWRDERVARVARSWRVVYQPLVNSWRVSLGGLNQSYPTLPEALAATTRSAGWKVADLAQVENDGRNYIEFSYRLDTAQLPSFMQIGLGGPGEWAVGVERTVKVDKEP